MDFSKAKHLCDELREQLTYQDIHKVKEIASDLIKEMGSNSHDADILRTCLTKYLNTSNDDSVAFIKATHGFFEAISFVEKKYRIRVEPELIKRKSTQIGYVKWSFDLLKNNPILVAIIVFYIVLIINPGFVLNKGDSNLLKIISYGLHITISGFVIFITCKYYKIIPETTNQLPAEEEEFVRKYSDKLPEFNDGQNSIHNRWLVFKQRINSVMFLFCFFWIALWSSWIFSYSIKLCKLLPIDNLFLAKATILNIHSQNISNLCIAFMAISFLTSTSKIRNLPWDIPLRFNISRIYIWALMVMLLITIWLAFDLSHNDSPLWTRALTGIFSGVAMCFFCGRILDNKLISLPPIILASIYLYGLIRAAYPFVLESHIHYERQEPFYLHIQGLATLIIHVAFFLKFILLTSILWLIKTKRLHYLCMEECSLYYKNEEGFEYFASKIKF